MTTRNPLSATEAKRLLRRAKHRTYSALRHDEIIRACNRFFQKRDLSKETFNPSYEPTNRTPITRP
jgi:hypothetical protein